MKKALLIMTLVVLIGSLAAAAESPAKRKPAKPSATEASSDVPASSMTIWQARKAVLQGIARMEPDIDRHVGGWVDHIKINLASAKIRPESVEFEAVVTSNDRDVVQGPRTFKIELTGAPDIEGRKCPGFVNRGLCKGGYGVTELGKWKYEFFWWSDPDDADAFATAINRLRSAARGEDGDGGVVWQDFSQKAGAWRALPSKPPIPEGVRAHRLVAEDALREKDFDRAITEYEDGLAAYPVWPEGHFNAALICAELGYYAEAIRHMRGYVELLPDAPDAQAARDQILIWQAKARRSLAGEGDAVTPSTGRSH